MQQSLNFKINGQNVPFPHFTPKLPVKL